MLRLRQVEINNFVCFDEVVVETFNGSRQATNGHPSRETVPARRPSLGHYAGECTEKRDFQGTRHAFRSIPLGGSQTSKASGRKL